MEFIFACFSVNVVSSTFTLYHPATVSVAEEEIGPEPYDAVDEFGDWYL